MPEVSEMVWNDFFSHFSLNADGSRSYDGVQVKRNAVFADAKGHWAQNAIENGADEIDYVIPGNDDAIRAVKLIAGAIANAVIEGRDGNDTAEEAATEEASEEAAE